MKLWILRRKEHPKKDSFLVQCVVRAETPHSARTRVAARYGESEVWRDGEHSTCVELHVDGQAGMIITDFSEG